MKTIVWDVDDVLNDLMRVWFEQSWRPAHPQERLDYAGISRNPPHALLGVPKHEYLASLDAFRLSPAGSDLQPIPEVCEWFARHGHRFRHAALTATPLRAAAVSAAWVMQHFGQWVRSFHVIPSPRHGPSIPVYDQTKEEFLNWWRRADILVEDNADNAAAAERLGMRAILMPRPWNGGRGAPAEALAPLAALA